MSAINTKLQVKKLNNGLQLINLNSPSALTATALVMVKTGSKYESIKENGLSHFLEHLFFKGTKNRPNALLLSSALDSLGSEYNAFTSKEYTGYWIKTAAGRLGPALDILADMLAFPLFPKEEVEREKGVIIEEIKMYEDNPLMHIEDVFETCLYGDTPAGWEVIGTRKNILSFSRQSLINYYQRQYGANSHTLILSGAITKHELSLANRLFSVFPKNKWQDKLAVKDQQTKPALKIVRQKIDQVNLSLGVRAFPVGHPQETTLKLLSLILGGSMSSRLFINLRERRGLAYYVKTIAEQYSDSGYLTTQAGVPLDKVTEAIQVIINEYRKIVSEKIEPIELQRVKDMAIGRLQLHLESSDDLANWYGRQVITRSQFISPNQYIKALQKVSANQLQQVAQAVFSQPLNLAVIGNISDQKTDKLFNCLVI